MHDPDGRFGVFGLVVGAGLEIARQGIAGELEFSAKSIGKVAVAGAAGVNVGLAGNTANNATDGKSLTKNAGKAALLGGGGAATGSPIGN